MARIARVIAPGILHHITQREELAAQRQQKIWCP